MTRYIIHPLVVGVNETDQGIMTYQRGYGRRIILPVYSFLLAGAGQRVLVDTGMEDFMPPPGMKESCGFEAQYFEDALARFGLKPTDIDLVIQTHLHNDHCENTPLCRSARVVVQKAELQFAGNPHPIDHRYFPDLLDDLDLEVIEGDREILPGLRVILTPGHTPGGQSVAVETDRGTAVITGFCCNDENFPANGPVVTPGVHTDAIAAYESAKRIRETADLLLPCHSLSLGRNSRLPD